MKNICMIGGTGRSGTTILKVIFSKHQKTIANIPEWRFTIDPDGLVDFYNTVTTSWSPYLYDLKLSRLKRFLHNIGRSRPISRFLQLAVNKLKIAQSIPIKITGQYALIDIINYCPQYFYLVDKLIKQLTEFNDKGVWVGKRFGESNKFAYGSVDGSDDLAKTLSFFYYSVIDGIQGSQDASHYVEDNTWNILYFDTLLKLIPNAKLVHIYRDPRDVVASFSMQNWMPNDFLRSAKIYADLMKRWHKVRTLLPKDSFKEISLESLIGDMRIVTQDLCDFWGLNWDESLMQVDLSRGHCGRWKKEMSLDQQKKVNDILKDDLAEFGYV